MKLKYVTTTFPGNIKTIEHSEVNFIKDIGVENQIINIYPEVEEQIFDGFGGAFTEASGYVYSKMNERHKEEVISTYFDSDKMNYVFGRIHIDSCDFSLGQYEAMSDENDIDMKSFSLNRSWKYILPFVNDVQEKSDKKIELMISPWSPPAFMKTNFKRVNGGKLRSEYQHFWADYICKYIIELRRAGFVINRMSIQNEPAAVQTWDSCIYSGKDEKRFLKDYLYPALQKNKIDDIEIFIWDHNKERIFERACEIIDEETEHMVSGIAFHWYSGDHFEALELVRKKFPSKKLILSESCIEYSKFNKEDYLANAQKYAHDIIGNLNAGMNAFYDWNLLLNEEGGPNHVHNLCDAPYLYDIKKHKLMERNTLSYIWHFSHYIQPGAVRIGFSRYTTDIDVTTFKNPDGTIICVILNREKEEKNVIVRLKGKIAEIKIKPEAIVSMEIR